MNARPIRGWFAPLLSLLICMVAGATPPVAKPTTRPIHVACVGDSITAGATIRNPERDGYPAQLQRMLGDGYVVTNFGYSGATLLSKGDRPYIKHREYTAALADRADVVVIALGTNDSKAPNWAHASEFATDYEALIDSFRKANPAAKVYVCEPPPAFPGSWGIRESVIAGEVGPDVKQIATDNGATFIDLHTPLKDDGKDFKDTVHPNAEGAGKIAKVVYDAIVAP